MKIFATSDLHGQLPKEPCPECDLLIIAGDVCPDLKPAERQGEWLSTVFIPWILDQPARYKAMIWGNHDFIGVEALSHYLPSTLYDSVVLLKDDGVVIEQTKIYGFSWVPNLPRWAFSFPGDVPTGVAAKIPENTDILISHGPPHGYLDVAPVCNLDGDYHVGSKTLASRLRIAPPKHVICGHIHGGRGWAKMPEGAEIWNVASLDDWYYPYKERFVEILYEQTEAP